MLDTEKLEGWNTMEMVKLSTFNFLPFAPLMLKREVTKAAVSLQHVKCNGFIHIINVI